MLLSALLTFAWQSRFWAGRQAGRFKTCARTVGLGCVLTPLATRMSLTMLSDAAAWGMETCQGGFGSITAHCCLMQRLILTLAIIGYSVVFYCPSLSLRIHRARHCRRSVARIRSGTYGFIRLVGLQQGSQCCSDDWIGSDRCWYSGSKFALAYDTHG
jgi:hypothetical protein